MKAAAGALALLTLAGCSPARPEQSAEFLARVTAAARDAEARHEPLRVRDVFGDDISAACAFVDTWPIAAQLRDQSPGVETAPIYAQIIDDDFMPSDEAVYYVVDRGGRPHRVYQFSDFNALYPLGGLDDACVGPNAIIEFEPRHRAVRFTNRAS